MPAKQKIIDAFDLMPGRVLGRKYEVLSKLGGGWEGEVYKIRELNTNIERAAKLFYPHRNVKNRTSEIYANKLHKLRDCHIVIKYHTSEVITFRQTPVTMLISEYVDGDMLSEFLERQPGKRIPVFQGLHLLHALITGIENIHYHGEYHGDLHTDNVMVRKFGLAFDLKILDLFHRGRLKKEVREDDICDSIRIFYDAVGGQKHYHKQPPQVKEICCGLKRSLILKKFKTASALRVHLETMSWD